MTGGGASSLAPEMYYGECIVQGKPLPVLRRSSALLDPFVWMIAAISVTKAE